MFKGLFFTVFVICFFLGASAQAQDYADESEDFASLAYKKTMELCSINYDEEGRATFNWDMWTLVKYGAVASFKIIDDDSMRISKPVIDLINSRGYEMALDECYGPANSSRWAYISHKAFAVALFAADAGGHIIGLLPFVSAWEAFGRIFAATRFAMDNPALIRAGAWTFNAANRIGLAVVGVYAGWDAYKDYDLRKNAKEYFEASEKQMLNEVSQQKDATYQDIERRLAGVNAQLAMPTLTPERRQYLLARKAQFEERLRERNAPPTSDDINVTPK